jgi:GSH-dependent disulfide-bond oxidoreductase
MIRFYYDQTPNGRKILVALEELKLPYEVHWIDVKSGEQFAPAYLAINPNAKIPAIVDTDGPGGEPIAIFESGAILLYLAHKAGALLPADPRARWEATCWVVWQVANQGPASGNAAHFTQYAPAAGIDDEYAKARYITETRRCARVLDDHLRDRSYVAGDEYSIADIACFPWTRVLKAYGIDIADFPALAEWSARISARPAAQVKVERPAGAALPPTTLSAAEYTRLFGVDPHIVPSTN